MAPHHTKLFCHVNPLATLLKLHLVWGVGRNETLSEGQGQRGCTHNWPKSGTWGIQDRWWVVIICKTKFTQVKGASLEVSSET